MPDEQETTPADPTHRVSTTGDVEVSTYLEIASEEVRRTAGTAGQATVDSDVPPKRDAIAIIDFGSQYSRLIARRVRELNVYCEIVPPDATRDAVRDMNLAGIILSGGPSSVYEEGAPTAPAWVFDAGVPVLGICYGMQLIAHQLGGHVAQAAEREYGFAVLHRNDQSVLLDGLEDELPVWMSHGDRIDVMPQGFRAIAFSENSPIAAMANDDGIYGIQFHPEVAHTPQGVEMLRNFAYKVCGLNGSWTPNNFVSESIARIREQVGTGKVICALSGGVDSAVTAKLVHEAIGDQLTCIFVNNGLLRREEPERVREVFEQNLGLKLIYVDATERFMTALAGVTDPEQKRKIIGNEFINVFEIEAGAMGEVDFLAQGTLYPDVIESQTSESTAAHKIKTHHNVGGLPERMRMKLVEPLRYLFKDEVRLAGAELGLPPQILNRQPFPGPGLAIRVIGDITWDKLETLRAADWIVMDEIKADGLYDNLWQSFAVLTNTQTVGVMGDQRTYQHVVALRAVTSEDAMTADWARLPYDTLARISSRIVNEVPAINRVVYDITSKPPGTIEWE
ncbi:MAG: glutamine-hydrolyzing GMP synthase [Chloroflexi bacterium]|nr:glutamine-hydrolyzing GMP synthase [Chloroflexota bacterium]MDA1174667.1 glutamine-hydrolyzing GMP synthase [Chloroflexota bacterium]